jgi:hypothetical protein
MIDSSEIGNLDRSFVVDLLVKAHSNAQEFCSTIAPLSLRDIDRSFRTLRFFFTEARELCPDSEDLTPLLLAIAVTYYYRIPHQNRKEFEESLSEIAGQFVGKVKDAQAKLISFFELDNDISKTQNLLENSFLLFTSILCRIPLFVIGRPGTAKSYSLSLLMNQMRGERSACAFFRKFPPLQRFYVQCSQNTSARELETCFGEAQEFQRRSGGRSLGVVVLDEAGLMELNPSNPLKILHKCLDIDNSDYPVACVGLSNWILDAAKMNRAVIRITHKLQFSANPTRFAFSSKSQPQSH